MNNLKDIKSYNHYFDDDINKETINTLVDKLQEVDGKINLYFTTLGGYKDAMMYLIYFLNQRKEDVTVILMNRIASAGTFLLTEFYGELKIDSGLDFILFHAFDRESYSIRKSDNICEKTLTKQDIEGNKIFAKKLKQKGILTDKQIKQYLKGDNVVLYKKDIDKCIH